MSFSSKKHIKQNPSRRDALKRFTALSGAAGIAACQTSPVVKKQADIDAEFNWGVASGDPTHSSFIIWTRALPNNLETGLLNVAYEVSVDKEFKQIVRAGIETTSIARDFTVKLDVEGMKSGQAYFYRFKAGKAVSPIGRAKTLPQGNQESINIALASCANFPSGFYNAYREISKIEDLDAIIHVGDYIYETAAGKYDGATGKRLGRVHRPAHEIKTLADYRTRFAQYREDADLQAAHAAAPFISVWDDHETANNSWEEGASGHTEDKEGKWVARRDAALQAYFEWMPIRDPVSGQARQSLNRVYDFADIVSIVVIETRLTGRSEPANYPDLQVIESQEDLSRFEEDLVGDPSRTMMGRAQEEWFADSLKVSRASGVSWQMVANQTVMARMRTPNFMTILDSDIVDPVLKKGGYTADWLKRSSYGLPVGLDNWDGYPQARKRFYEAAKAADANLVVLSGDSHMFWANELNHPDTEERIGIEFAAGSITSPGGYGYINKTEAFYDSVEKALVEKNKDVCFSNVNDHGFIHLNLSKSRIKARYIAVDTILDRNYTADCFLEVETDLENKKLTRLKP